MFNTSHDYEVSILVNGRAVTEVQYSGHTYIEGRKNSIYELQIRNKTPNRILAIPAVDGLNVLDGENCGVRSPGYVIDPWGVVTIPGWKVDSQQAAKFVFKPQNASHSGDKTYSESIGADSANQGIIGVMVFRQKILPSINLNLLKDQCNRPSPTIPNSLNDGVIYRSKSAQVTCDSFSAHVSSNIDQDANKSLGTGFGESTGFQTQDTEFERASVSPESVFIMYYDTIQGLKNRGVPIEQFRPSPTNTPNPFPASPNITRGCEPPAGWNSKRYHK